MKKNSMKRNLIIACYIIASPLALHYIEVPLLVLQQCPSLRASSPIWASEFS